MKNRILVPVVLVIVLSLAGYYLLQLFPLQLFQKSKTNGSNTIPKTTDEVLNREQTVNVTATGGKFTPNSFKVELFDTLILNISAVDQNYTFKVRDYPRMDTSIAAGKTAIAKIEFLGVGEYIFDCGQGCTGTITVVQERDTEGEEPQ